MITRVLIIAIVSGLAAGIVVTGVQLLRVMPLVKKAEIYESEPRVEAHTHDKNQQGTHDHDVWAPKDGVERTAFTLLANVLTAVGFGFLLNAALTLYGRAITFKKGVVWGVAGFSVFALAPGIGMPPELPGMQAAGLFERKAWYFGTIFATGAGLAMIVFIGRSVFWALGTILIIVPHVIGAPHPAEMGGSTPPELAAMFVTASLLTTAVLWIVLGGVSGYLHQRFANTG